MNVLLDEIVLPLLCACGLQESIKIGYMLSMYMLDIVRDKPSVHQSLCVHAPIADVGLMGEVGLMDYEEEPDPSPQQHNLQPGM